MWEWDKKWDYVNGSHLESKKECGSWLKIHWAKFNGTKKK